MNDVKFSAAALGRILAAVNSAPVNGAVEYIPNVAVQMHETVAVATSAHTSLGGSTFIVWTFTAEDEDMSLSRHLADGCGWSPKKIKEVKARKHAWFSARVDAILLRYGPGTDVRTVHLGTDYLGACLYDSVTDFVMRYRDDYLLDMMHECLPDLSSLTSRRLLEASDMLAIEAADDALTKRKAARFGGPVVPSSQKMGSADHA